MIRRSTLDVRLGRALTVDQTWEEIETGDCWHVRQVHRADCHVELSLDGMRACIPFAVLRHNYRQVEARLEAA